MMRFIIITLLTTGLFACRSTRKIQTAIAPKDSTTTAAPKPVADSVSQVQALYEALDSARIPFQTFSAKINVDYRDAEGKRYDLNANLRMIKDSAIWISVNAILGIEAIRMLVTTDSVKLLDKQSKTYTARRIDYLQEVTALPLNLPTLQDLLIGNAVFVDSSNGTITANSEAAISLLSIGRYFKNMLTLSAADRSLQRSKLDDVDATRSRTADLYYSNYENKAGVRFATGRRINVVEKKTIDVQLDFKQYTFNEEVSFPFSIPKNFKPR